MVVGIDEVGRGPWAGPLVFGAVVLGGDNIDGLTDSKKLSKKKREALDQVIRAQAVSYGLGWVSAEEIDSIGLSAACSLACRRALEQIETAYSEIIIDGVVNFLKDTGKGPYVTTIKQADLLVPSVSAASVLAKVARDRFMEEQDTVYPGYGFASHVGYGTKTHRDALAQYGVTPLHRKSFAPIAEMLGGTSSGRANNKQRAHPTSREVGDVSESVASEYLERNGYDICERNWKTRVCEIDIVARKDNILYFVEVKHRTSDQQGGGMAAITSKKLEQMRFAARVYAHHTHQDMADMRLVVISTSEKDLKIVDFLILN